MPEYVAKISWARLLADDSGATLIENAVMWGLVAFVVVGVFDANHAVQNLKLLATTFNLR